MTITFNRFALLPKRCDKCGRRFIWEPYYSYKYDKEVGFQTVKVLTKHGWEDFIL